jgi:hypothetical protein
MGNVRTVDGKVLMVDDLVAAHEDCCCFECMGPELFCEYRSVNFTVCGYVDDDCKVYSTKALRVEADWTDVETYKETVWLADFTYTTSHEALANGTDSDGGVYDCLEECVMTGSASRVVTTYRNLGHTVKQKEYVADWTPTDPDDDCKADFYETEELWQNQGSPPDYEQGPSLGVTEFQSSTGNSKTILLNVFSEDANTTHTETLSGRYTNAGVRAATDFLLSAVAWSGMELVGEYGTCEAEYDAREFDAPDPSSEPCENEAVRLTEIRYRVDVPATYEGSYLRAEWDEVFVATDGGADIVTAKSRTWTDPASKTGAVATVVVPSGRQGYVRIYNMRYQCSDGGTVHYTGDSYP